MIKTDVILSTMMYNNKIIQNETDKKERKKKKVKPTFQSVFNEEKQKRGNI